MVEPTAAAAPEDLRVLDGARDVAALLPPLRRRILGTLTEPDSATGLARRLGLTRQKVNYHLRELERAGLVECAEERQRRGCKERLMRVTARAFVLSPRFLGALGADPDAFGDRLSSAALLAAASRALHDVGILRERARRVERELATLTLETEVAFASAADRAAFGNELTGFVAELVERYHRPDSETNRPHRFVLLGHPALTKSTSQADAEEAEHAARSERPNQAPEETVR